MILVCVVNVLMRQNKRTKMTGKVIVVALGGNSIKKSHEKGTAEEQFAACDVTAQQLAQVVHHKAPEDRVIITHGNGPQAGNLALQQLLSKETIPAQPFDVVGAMTQGQIGYMFMNRMRYHLDKLGNKTSCVPLVNQVLVDKDDKEFEGENASKPVGNFMTEEEAMEWKRSKGWIVKKVKPAAEKPWRRVVPSPDPKRNVEVDVVKTLVAADVVPICSGGGGIPVIYEDGLYKGVEAVIDKDLAGERLCEGLGASTYLILTDVPYAVVNYSKPEAKNVETVTLAEMQKYYDEGHFLAGSMGPKVKACMRFVEWGGKEAIITSLDKALDGIQGKCGTHIVPN